jgi:uncharacterized protein YcfJ
MNSHSFTMKPLLRARWISLITAIALCNADAATSDQTVRRARAKFESRNTYAEGIIGGATIGAAIGALLGGLYAASQHQNVAQGAGVGAIIGAGTGAVAGKNYADQKVRQRREYLAREQGLENAIKNARSTRLAANDFNRVLASRLRDARQQSTTGTLSDARAVQSALNREIARQRKLLASAAMSVSNRSELNAEIQGLVKEERQLQSNIDRFGTTLPSIQRPH